MHSYEVDRRADHRRVFDTAFWVAAAVVAHIATFSVLIIAIFATNSGNATVMMVGSAISMAGPAVLLLMIFAKFASSHFSARGGLKQKRTVVLVNTVIYCVGTPALVIGAWACAQPWKEMPLQQESSLEVRSAMPAF